MVDAQALPGDLDAFDLLFGQEGHVDVQQHIVSQPISYHGLDDPPGVASGGDVTP